MEFTYRVKNQSGETLKGVVEADTKEKAVTLLQERDYYVIDLKKGNGLGINWDNIQFSNKVGYNEVVIFTRQLATMINAGLTLNDALFSLKEQVSPKFADIIEEIIGRVEAGQPLGTALEGWPNVFNDIYVASVKSGEAAGVLDQVLLRLADDLEEKKEFRSEVKGALIYPAIVVVMMVIVAAIMMIFVIPKMMALYEDLDADLPTATKALMTLSDWSVRFWWVVLAGLAGAIYGFFKLKNTEEGARKLDEIILSLPIIGPLQKKTILADFTQTLGLLLSTGISLVEALDIVSEAVGNRLFREKIKQAARGVEKGRALSTMLSDSELFPPILYQMVAVGEGTGKMDEALKKISGFFKSEAEAAVQGLTTALGPVIMIILGIGVLFLVVAVIMPIYNLTSSFS